MAEHAAPLVVPPAARAARPAADAKIETIKLDRDSGSTHRAPLLFADAGVWQRGVYSSGALRVKGIIFNLFQGVVSGHIDGGAWDEMLQRVGCAGDDDP